MNKKTIGLIGCSQLSMYLAQAARNIGHTVIGLSDKKNDPAVKWCDSWIKGKSNNLIDIIKISKQCDFIIFEDKMHFSDSLLKKNKILTSPSSIHHNQYADLWTMKELLYDFEIAQTGYIKINSSDDFYTAFNFFKSKVVFKKRFSEKGKPDTFKVNTLLQLKKIKNDHKGYESHFLAEPFISFSSEHRLIIARNENNQFAHYPLFSLDQKNNQYNLVFTDLLNSDLNQKIKKLLFKIEKMMTHIDYQGVLTVSLFKKQNEFLVYDIDTRPTNTGLITMMGFSNNQFNLHLQGILNLKINPIEQLTEQITCQYLISGQKGQLSKTKIFQKNNKSSQIYLYGKTGKTKNRKLGHVIYVN